jgi:hypothetical protein
MNQLTPRSFVLLLVIGISTYETVVWSPGLGFKNIIAVPVVL